MRMTRLMKEWMSLMKGSMRTSNCRAVSVIEYTLLVTMLLLTFIVMQKYVVRAISGRWKQVGDSFGFGRQYDPKKTLECGYSANGDFWYEIPLAESKKCLLTDAVCLGQCKNPRCD